jgi:uncharacterized protein (DUF1697 family)
MPRYAAFLRAVNLGPTNKASKEQLREAFEGAGLEHVSTFRTSGNVVFETGGEAVGELTARIEKALSDSLGFDVPVYLRTEKELLSIASAEPFDAAAIERSKGKLQVGLLLEKPSVAARKKVLALATEDDLLAFGERELFWLPSGGTLETKLDQKTIAKLTGPQTARTMGTIEAIANKFFGA